MQDSIPFSRKSDSLDIACVYRKIPNMFNSDIGPRGELYIHVSCLSLASGVSDDKCEPVERSKKCPGYGDKSHLTHCCLSKSEITPYYCCSLQEKERINTDLNSTFTNKISDRNMRTPEQ
uniref:Uncharacterized protein n=1 Tax=Romanomermis culicivorax TaxID=13658 RepID=A0A915IY96_ROMCU